MNTIAYWITRLSWGYFVCSECGYESKEAHDTCPHCHAKMGKVKHYNRNK